MSPGSEIAIWGVKSDLRSKLFRNFPTYVERVINKEIDATKPQNGIRPKQLRSTSEFVDILKVIKIQS